MNTYRYSWIESYDPGLEWDMPIHPRPVFSMLDDTAHQFGDRPAIDFLGRRFSWGQIHDLAEKFAAGLQEKGVGKGTRVGILLPNSPYYLIAYYAILMAGAIVVNLNPLYAQRELAHQIEDSDTEIVVTADLATLFNKARSLLRETGLRTLIVCRFADSLPFPKNCLFPLLKFRDLAKISSQEECVYWFHDLTDGFRKLKRPDIDSVQDVAVLQYTGGTTGVPKAAMLTHANIHANTVQSLSWFPEARLGHEKMLGVLPFFHVFAMTAVMNLSVLAGFEIIALPRFVLKETMKTIHCKKPNFFPAVPAIYSAINNYENRAQYDLSSLKYCISGGAPLPVEVKKIFEATTGCVVVEGYGLTESSPVACINPVQGENIAGSIGLPVPQTVVEIVDPADGRTLLPPGQSGELCIRGPQVMKGYWKNPAETDLVLRPVAQEGYRLHTGDLARMDERGYVYIVGRLKEMIITNGYNVYPRNVEEAIYLHPAVEECIVAGIPDPHRGEVVKAWIKLKTGQLATAEDFKAFLKDKISPMEIPRVFEFRDAPLPKTLVGKLSRRDILAQEADLENS